MPQPTHEQSLQLALQHHQAGCLPQAEQLYRQILTQNPRHPEALHFLGVIAFQVGKHGLAIDLIRQSLAITPKNPSALNNLGNALRAKGQLPEALLAYRQALALKPNYPEVHNSLGNVLRDQKQLEPAINAFRQALAQNPNYPEAHFNLGIALMQKSQTDPALAAFQNALALKPNYPAAHNNLGIVLQQKKQFPAAIAAFQKAVALNPRYPEALANLGNALKENGQLKESIAAQRQALQLNPNSPDAWYSLTDALFIDGQFDEALAAARQALALHPNLAKAYCNVAAALWHKNQPDAVIAACRRALALDPAFADARLVLAHALLIRGEFPQGWAEYECRSRCKDFGILDRNFPQPLWDGSPLHGKTILLHAEQGFGDTLQFIRFVPLIAAMGAKVIVDCQPPLQRLLQSVPGISQVIAATPLLPHFDFHCLLLSLPHALNINQSNMSPSIPYLSAAPADIDKWKTRLAPHAASLKVGLAWAGNPNHKNDRNRSIPLSLFAPLAALPNIQLFSLQKPSPSQPAPFPLIDLMSEVTDFADTAALLTNLDLIISVDSAVAHLAGALAKTVWTLLPFAPDWRWLLDRQDSPWYPTMRLFRQPAINDWPTVIHQLAAALLARTP